MTETPDCHERLAEMCSVLAEGNVECPDVRTALCDLAFATAAHFGAEETVRILSTAEASLSARGGKHANELDAIYGICLLAGEVLHDAGQWGESRRWLEKAVCANASGAEAFHDLAINAIAMGDSDSAIRALENEIAVAPGNYYAYTLLASLYEKSAMTKEPNGLSEHCSSAIQGTCGPCIHSSFITASDIPTQTFRCSATA